MQMLKRFLKIFEKRGRSDPVSARDHWILGLVDKIDGTVTDDEALAISAVYACIRVISETIASLPLKFYHRRSDGGKDILPNYPLVSIFLNPNQNQTQFEFIETMCAHLCLRGNFYSGKNYKKNGWPSELIPLDPSRMDVEVKNNVKKYRYADEKGLQVEYDPVQIWHIKGLSYDGIMGYSPIEYARKALNLSIAAEKHGITYYENGTRTSGIAKHPGKLSETARERLQTSLNSALSGDNKFKIIVFEEGLDWMNMGMSNEDSQYLQTRQFQTEEICRIFRVPAVLINHPDKTMTYASAEQFFLSFVVHTIRPWLERIETSINRWLIPQEDQKKGIFAEFTVDGLLRGDIKSRYSAYAIGRQWGWLSVDDIRALENLNPLKNDAGNIYLQPMNMTDASKDDKTSFISDNKDEDDDNATSQAEKE